ncbi:MAG TPA: enoyl-CoA hydratase-related protein, partial [Planctomycetota bacterium]|nr:enoyl-CoA hydratase-related protein [Planctomycetota bacterium]
GTQRLPGVVGLARAKELIFTARRIDAARALRIGLVGEVVEPAALRDAAQSLAREIAANGPLAIAAAKQALGLAERAAPLPERLAGERELYLERILPSRDRLEALSAFRDKRKPVWRGE